jgi:hypothetical protein
MDRRSWFFFWATLVIVLTIPITPSDLRWVPIWLAVLYVVLTLLCIGDHIARRREPETDELNRSDP